MKNLADTLRSGIKSLKTIVENDLKGVEQRVTEEVRTERLAKCHGCPKLNKTLGQCTVCLCFVTHKTKFKQEACPEGRWHAVKDSSEA